MKTELDSNSVEILNHFYKKLENRIISSHNRIEGNSLLLTLIKLPTNHVSKLLTDSTLNSKYFSLQVLEGLANNGYVRKADDLDRPQDYVITTFGIWYIESSRNDINISRLLQYFQETNLSFKVSNKPLKDVEKIILFSMMSIRNFSLDTSMDINNMAYSDCWIDIFDSCTKFLSSNKMISKGNWKTSRSGNEHPISYVMRRANDLPQKTKHIYKTTGHNRYYLDVDNEEHIPVKKLLMLFSIIVKVESIELKEKIYNFMCDLAYENGKNVRENFKYVNHEWDSILKKAIDEYYFDL